MPSELKHTYSSFITQVYQDEDKFMNECALWKVLLNERSSPEMKSKAAGELGKLVGAIIGLVNRMESK